MDRFGERVRTLRVQRCMRQYHLAEAVGLTAAAISKIESNDRLPSIEVLVKLADVLQVPIGELAPTLDEVNLIVSERESAAAV